MSRFLPDFNLSDCAVAAGLPAGSRRVALGPVHSGGELLVSSVAPTLLESRAVLRRASRFADRLARSRHPGAGKLAGLPHYLPRRLDVPGYVRTPPATSARAALIWESAAAARARPHLFHNLQTTAAAGVDEPVAICRKWLALGAGNEMRFQRPVRTPQKSPSSAATSQFVRCLFPAQGHAALFEAAQSGAAVLSVPSTSSRKFWTRSAVIRAGYRMTSCGSAPPASAAGPS
jgi:hypothetical protein